MTAEKAPPDATLCPTCGRIARNGGVCSNSFHIPPNAALENLMDAVQHTGQALLGHDTVIIVDDIKERLDANDEARQRLREYVSERTLRRSIACAACGFLNTTPEPQ